MIYSAVLTREDGTQKGHSGRPSKKYLQSHKEFIRYTERGKHNEYLYTSVYNIVNGKLVLVHDTESHERNIGVCNF